MTFQVNTSAFTSTTVDASSISTSITPAVGDVVIAFVISRSTTSAKNVETNGVSGGSLTWYKRYSENYHGTTLYDTLDIYWAVATSASSLSVTATLTAATTGTGNGIAMGLVAVTGANTTTPFDVNASLPAVINDSDTSSTTIGTTVSTTAANTILFGGGGGAGIFASSQKSASATYLGFTGNNAGLSLQYEAFATPQTNTAAAEFPGNSDPGQSVLWFADAVQSAVVNESAAITTTLKAPTQTFQAFRLPVAAITTTLKPPTQTLQAFESPTARTTTTLKPPTQTLNAFESPTGVICTNLKPPTQTVHVARSEPSTICTNLPGFGSQTFRAISGASGSITTTLLGLSQTIRASASVGIVNIGTEQDSYSGSAADPILAITTPIPVGACFIVEIFDGISGNEYQVNLTTGPNFTRVAAIKDFTYGGINIQLFYLIVADAIPGDGSVSVEMIGETGPPWIGSMSCFYATGIQALDPNVTATGVHTTTLTSGVPQVPNELFVAVGASKKSATSAVYQQDTTNGWSTPFNSTQFEYNSSDYESMGGGHKFGSVAQTFAPTYSVTPDGQYQIIAGFIPSGAVYGPIVTELPGFGSQTFTGNVAAGEQATITTTLTPLSQMFECIEEPQAAITTTLKVFGQLLECIEVPQAAITTTLKPLSQLIDVDVTAGLEIGTIHTTLPAFGQAIVCVESEPCAITTTLPGPSQVMECTLSPSGAIITTLPSLSQKFNALGVGGAVIVTTLPVFGQSLDASVGTYATDGFYSYWFVD